ncbi:TonB-dependent receptor plug domain-containing protein [Roseateles chitosanitabidus]|jgi:iron complex outermembrane receptor protein|uniref:TonB-dependent receptor plug domain-containing protein n=1 Tax=Roseateles chitosanitabidus TaxID=65048 RepID=UPI00082D2B34|nr:TonB-dependent receptor [Roseateles chitosanitabidus]
MYKLNAVSLAVAATVAAASFPTLAQEQDQTKLERVVVTGSAIKRIDAETAVPVTVVKMDDLRKSGITSVEQVMANLTSVQASTNTTQSVGSSSGGASFADMRGIGADKTLVLLNGQRIANNAVDGSAPDLNMIPFAAIDRIEVLRDGASSLYGTDAIGGVINFITKSNYQGGTITVGFDSPEKSGGKSRTVNAGFGYGDLDKQGFNIFGFASYRKSDPINGLQRPYNARTNGGLSYSTDPANYTQDGKTFYNPAGSACGGQQMVNVDGDCLLTTSSFVDYAPKTETASGMLKGTFAVNADLTLGAELFVTQNKVTTTVAPVPYGGYVINPGTQYYPNNPALSPTFNDGLAGQTFNAPSSAFPNPAVVQPGYAYVYWRDFPNGDRVQMNKNNQSRLLLTAEGNGLGWDYSGAFSYNRNKVDQYLVGGYANGDMIGEGLLTGVINPFGQQSAAATQLLQDAALSGRLQYATGTVENLNAHASREVGDWLNVGRAAQLALGVEFRHEKFESAADVDFAQKVVASTGVDPNFRSEGSRKVYALYGELNVPVLKTLDLTASLRHDKYSDFGSSTNPKVSFRFQPMKELLVRGSASTGFRAPTLYELYGNSSFTNTGGNYANPLTCPDGTGTQCKGQFQVMNSGNPNLKPEKSKTATLGFVYEPISNASFGIDFWWVQLKDHIGSIPQFALFNSYYDYPALQQYFHFAPGNTLSLSSLGCPGTNCGYVDQTLLNLGKVRTNGLDLSAQYRLPTKIGQFDFALNSTYVAKYEFQDFKDGYWVQNVGTYGESGPVFRWQHNLTTNWKYDTFGAGVVMRYKSGYADFDPSTHARVASYTTFDLFGSWAPRKDLALTLGVRNLFDRAPPFTNQEDLFQGGGWDSRYVDPTGRAYYVRATYSF